ncbi:E3 ubiquitin-protein ligase TRIM33-like [Stegodyphus dumicola]|uniref:E3 ubiquitin-protein ligase TRIM33-like n=1 Tax=Stegodyphus dumicola TaxID=202533 RepID=UPI0015AD6CE8|nr:E3 ubiquitin-protein ligase TRIM33-like [Stegodyphus dumicola]
MNFCCNFRFITDINKRGKALLQDLNKVCTDKKNQLNLKNQELRSVAERLKHCQKFAEAAISLGSETALVYSKKPIMNQLRRILRHRCEVPNPHHMVDIQFTYVSSFLAQYISSLGQILVDQQPIPGTTVNQNQMLPMPETVSQSPVPNTPPVIRQSPQMQQRAVPVPVQMNQQQQQHIGPYGQPQVTSSTDLARNVNNNLQGRQMMNNNKITYNRTIQRANMQQNQPTNFNMQPNVNYVQRNVVHQRQPAPQMRQHPQVQQQMQPQQQVQNPPAYNNTVQLPMPLRQNKSISVTPLPSPAGPSPSKQRAIAPRSVNMNPMNNQANNSVQRMNTNQASLQQRTPQVIDLDGPPNQKTPTMSNTNRLSHFPNIAATLAANPGLQIQPANYNNSNFQNTRPAMQLMTYNQNVLPQSVPAVNQVLTQASTLQSQPILTPQMAVPSAPPVKLYSIRTSLYNSNTPVFASPAVMSIANAKVATLATNTNTVNVVSAISPAMNAANITPTGNVINFVQVARNIPVSNISYTPNAISNPVPQNNNLTNVINNVTVTAESSLDSSLVTDINALTINPTSVQSATFPYEKSITTNENCDPKSSRSSSSESLPSLDELLKTDLSAVKTTENELLKTADLFFAKTSEISNVTMSGIFEEKSKDPNEDWCAVCKDGGELLCCSYCPKVYHFGCHVPALSKHPNDDDWRCVMCKDVVNCSIPNEGSKRKVLGVQGRDLLICERILLELFCHPKSFPFHNKVHKKVPNYYKIIKNPMDLSTIRMKLSPSHFEHYESVSDFLADVRLIFSNCYTFNPV